MGPNGLLMPTSLRLLPLFVLACLRSYGFRNGVSLDERSFTFAEFKSLPLQQLLLMIYPDLYRVDDLSDDNENTLIEEKTQSESDDNSENEDEKEEKTIEIR